MWAKTYGGGQQDQGASLAVSPDGSTVYVAGTHTVDEATLDLDWATIAYNTENGNIRWSRTYDAPAVDESDDGAAAVATSPNGQLVYVTGHKTGADGNREFRTVAYVASTGAAQWTANDRYGVGQSLAVSPDGSTLVVTGDYQLAMRRIGTIGYNAQTGDRLWLRVWDGPENIQALSRDIVMAPDGEHVFVAGIDAGSDGGYHYALLKYGTDGSLSWTRRYQGVPGYSEDFLTSVAITPDGGTVLATGYGSDGSDVADYATVAYDAGSGAKLWTKRFGRRRFGLRPKHRRGSHRRHGVRHGLERRLEERVGLPDGRVRRVDGREDRARHVRARLRSLRPGLDGKLTRNLGPPAPTWATTREPASRPPSPPSLISIPIQAREPRCAT